MNSKLLLTSILSIIVASSAYAENFPSDGSMQENKTYEDSATYDNTGVYSGTAQAQANYTPNTYTVASGEYLLSNTIAGTICPANSYCPGGDYVFNETLSQGITSCPATYGLSATGSSSVDECYRTCSYSDVLHSSSTGTFSGEFYSNSINKCEPVNDASCALGYHYKAGSSLNVDSNAVTSTYRYKSNSGTGDNSANTTGLANGEWDGTFSYGTLKGKALCSSTSGTYAETGTPNESGTGQYCWCKIDGFTPSGGSLGNVSGAWVFNYDLGDSAVCDGYCAVYCARPLGYYDGFRASMINSVQAGLAICEANVITITWDGAEASDIAANNAGTTTYDGDIRTPVKAREKFGHTFTGWTFIKPTE
ncbi:MAG: hypothetical protein MJ158_00245 [Alphaproteobacteria bacterium]|nr:hypothetical protein [Alphaproteobacteria bacterium]